MDSPFWKKSKKKNPNPSLYSEFQFKPKDFVRIVSLNHSLRNSLVAPLFQNLLGTIQQIHYIYFVEPGDPIPILIDLSTEGVKDEYWFSPKEVELITDKETTDLLREL